MTRDVDGAAGLFLDLDGTLADSVPALRAAYFAALASFGIEGSEEEFDRCNGLPMPEVLAYLREVHEIRADVAQLSGALGQEVVRAYADAPPRSGARELLSTAAALGMPVAVVTSSFEGFTRAWLARHELERFVSCVVDSTATAKGKPAPDPYLRALAETGCRGGPSLAVEDTRIGVESAVAAGISTVLIGARPAGRGDWPPLRAVVQELDEILELLAT